MPTAFVRIDNAVVARLLAEADGAAIRVFLALLVHADANGRCWPGVGRLAAMTGLSGRWVRESIRRLESLGIISVERRRGRGNVYTLPPVGRAEPQLPTPERSRNCASPGEELQTPKLRNCGCDEQDVKNENQKPGDVTSRPVAYPGVEDTTFWRSVTSLAARTANALAARLGRRLTLDDRDFLVRAAAFAIVGAGEAWLVAALQTTLERPRDNTVAYMRGVAARMAWDIEGRSPAAVEAERGSVLQWFARELRQVEIPHAALPKPTPPPADQPDKKADPLREAAAADPWSPADTAALRLAVRRPVEVPAHA